MTVYKMHINGTTCWFTLRSGRLRVHENSSSEQCEGCGVDIAETGVVRGTTSVACSCGARYPLTRVNQ